MMTKGKDTAMCVGAPAAFPGMEGGGPEEAKLRAQLEISAGSELGVGGVCGCPVTWTLRALREGPRHSLDPWRLVQGRWNHIMSAQI